jgi:DNA-binding PadR family transcriptional regulator
MLSLGNRTGYDIKQVVDKSTRHFWAASYSQIYPELRRLEDQGFVRGQPEPSGGRVRTAYELTEAGEAALRDWMGSDESLLYEVRDEGMLKLFFSDSLPDRRLENIRAMRELQQRKLSQLEAIQQHAHGMHPGPRMTLELGISITQGIIDWCEAAEPRLGEK